MSDRFTRLRNYDFSFVSFVMILINDIQESDGVLHISLRIERCPLSFPTLPSRRSFKSIDVQDFPIRGQRVFLKIKRRRWIDTDTEKLVYRDWNLIAKGTRITEEFATFLKEVNRYPAL